MREFMGVQLVPARLMFDRMNNTFDAIARRAFELFDSNGRQVGHDTEDWLRAEAELLHPVHLDVAEANGTLSVRAEVPGFAEQDIEVSVEPRRLTISARRELAKARQQGETVYSEHCSDQVFRVVDLPTEVDAASSAVKATYDRGVLTIALPKVQAAKRRQIKVEPKPA